MGEHRRQILCAICCNDAYSNSYSQPDTHPNSNSYCYSHSDANSHSDRTIQPDANTITDFYRNSDSGTWRN